MFNFLRSIWNLSAQRQRGNRRALGGGVRLNYECLESRRLLFAASVINVPQDWKEPVDSEPIYAPPMDVSLDVRPGRQAGGRTIPERWTLMPSPQPAMGGGGFYWPENPGQETYDRPPPVEYPDSSAPGGLVQIDESQATPAGPLAEAIPDREAREVLALLAALQFVPGGQHAVSEDALKRLADDVALLSAPQSADSARLDQPRSEGGMIGLVREALVDAKSDTAGGGGGDTLSTVEESGIESIRERYQAFEVSTAEVSPNMVAALKPSAARPEASCAARVKAVAQHNETNSAADAMEWIADVPADIGGEDVELPAGERANLGSGWANTPCAALPAPGEAGSSRMLRAVAAFLFLLYSSRTARSTDRREPERGGWAAQRGCGV